MTLRKNVLKEFLIEIEDSKKENKIKRIINNK